MKLSIRQVATIAAAALGVAGCGGGGGENENAARATAGGGIVAAGSVDGTDVLADSQGRTLYSAAVEKDGKILCVKACTSIWQPLLGSPDDARSAASDLGVDLGVVKRPDGDQQLTLDGKPLYTFTQEARGQLKGDGFVDDFQGTHFEWKAAGGGGGTGGGGGNAGTGGGYDY